MTTNNAHNLTLVAACVLVTLACTLVTAYAQIQPPVRWAKPGGCNATVCGATCNGSFECPLPTLQAALDALPGGGGQVSLYQGTYEASNIRLSGGEFTISSGQGIQSATIDCGGNPGFTVENGNFDFISLVVTNCQRPGGNGGAFFARYGSITLDIVKVTNSGAAKGGALYLESGSGFSYRSFITDNTATESGGGIYISGSQFNIVESNLTNNQPDDVACFGSTIAEFRPIATGQVSCLAGCNSALCSAPSA